MNHLHLCPKKTSKFKRCQCVLISLVREEVVSLVQSYPPDFNKVKSHWYYSGRQDAAEEIETLMHDEPCDCDTCKIFVLAYRAALGVSNDRS